MNPPSLIKQAFMRLFLAALVAALLATLASCGGPNASEPGIDLLSAQIQALNEAFTNSQKQADRLAFWQLAVALLVVVSGFALIGGAALGSIARRESGNSEGKLETQTTNDTHHENDEKLR
ncbi:MAG: hypothetical protein KDM63_18295 [Verrucomicrobiae bacterium]|nr:hypothetical protein [Verrucomicrobiae bacterium]